MGLSRALKKGGAKVGVMKIGPDFIDPAFLSAAAGTECRNIDPWAMRASTITHINAITALHKDFTIVEGVMGLFDGAMDNSGSTADVASILGLPVLLVINCKGMGASIGALAKGFSTFRNDVVIGGVLLNHVNSPKHEYILRKALESAGIETLGAIPQDSKINIPSRYLGLIQAREQEKLETIIESAANLIEAHSDLKAIEKIACNVSLENNILDSSPIPPIGQQISIAHDDAFSFIYPSVIEKWKYDGASLNMFSPLNGEIPSPDSDAIYLPGGYPQLHAGRISANQGFYESLQTAAKSGVTIYGECGGYITLGKCVIDENGDTHKMANIFPIETSFYNKKMHLGYREAILCKPSPLGQKGTVYRGHEFHYANVKAPKHLECLFNISDSSGRKLGGNGHRIGNVMGSFIHLIDVHNTA